jgi:tetratricopeptide (TPR) repeat protein
MDSNAHNDMADVYRIKGEYKKAIDLYEKAISIDPFDTNAMLEKAQCLVQLGEKKAAEIQLEELVSSFPSSRDSATAIVIKGTMRLREKKYGQAYELFNHALDFFPFNRAVLFQTALSAYFLKKYQDSEKILQKILEMTPEDKRTLALLAKVQKLV